MVLKPIIICKNDEYQPVIRINLAKFNLTYGRSSENRRGDNLKTVFVRL